VPYKRDIDRSLLRRQLARSPHRPEASERPSYLSRLWALGFHDMIPERVVLHTSVTPRPRHGSPTPSGPTSIGTSSRSPSSDTSRWPTVSARSWWPARKKRCWTTGISRPASGPATGFPKCGTRTRGRWTLTPSPNPEPVLRKESSCPVWGLQGFFDEETTQCRADCWLASTG